jgi:hypothetical protein
MTKALSAVLILALALPGVAFAAKPADKGTASAPGQLKKAEAVAESAESGTGEELEEEEAAEPDESDGSGKATGKPEWAAHPKRKDAKGKPDWAGKDASATPPGAAVREQARSKEASGSEDASPTAAGKQHGIENALGRIEANIARAQARVAEGTMERVPPGLLRVLEKFLGWLGLSPAPDDTDATDEGDVADDPGDASEEEPPTPEPGEEASPTPEPGDETSPTPLPEA